MNEKAVNKFRELEKKKKHQPNAMNKMKKMDFEWKLLSISKNNYPTIQQLKEREDKTRSTNGPEKLSR